MDPFDEIRREVEEFIRIMNEIEEALFRGWEGDVERVIEKYFGPNINYRIFAIGPDGSIKLDKYGGNEKNIGRYEINEDQEKYAITFELQHLKESPTVKATKDAIIIDGGEKYKDIIRLSTAIDPKSLKYTFKNGILDIEVKKKEK